MSRTGLRIILILLTLLIAVAIPILADGNSEIRKAAEAESYPEMAEHYVRAARRLER